MNNVHGASRFNKKWSVPVLLLGCLMGAATALAEKAAPVLIPAGVFLMGSEQGTGREQPIHEVWLDAFAIDRYEVSNRDYEIFQPGHRRSASSACDLCPVTLVSWPSADAFCRNRGGRLPTEAEWEKAARGPAGHRFSFGPKADTARGHFARAFTAGTVPVRSLAGNGYGLHHMSGNVWEWVADWFGSYTKGPLKNPQGPKTGFQKILRGGSWYNADYYVDAGMRFRLGTHVKLNSVGFRCARTVQPSGP